MHKRKYLSYVFAIVLVSGWAGCRSTDHFSYALVPQEQFSVPATIANGFIYPVYEDDSVESPLWGVFHGEKGRFLLYDVLSDEVRAEVYLPEVEANPDMYQGSLAEPDTFLLVDLDQHQLIKLTGQGDTAAVWQLPYAWNEYGSVTYNALVPTPINKVDETYYLSMRALQWDLSKPAGGLYEAPLFLAAAGAAPEQHSSLGVWPDYVKDPEHFALDIMPKLSRLRGDTVFYTFFADPHVYALDLTALTSTRATLPADAFTDFTPMNLAMLADISAASVFGVENSLYGGLTYDPYRDLLYRVVLHAMPLYREDGMENLMEDKPWSIQIIDAATMTEVGEAMVPDAPNYLPRALYPTPEGILIQHRSKISPADGDTIFTRFTLAH